MIPMGGAFLGNYLIQAETDVQCRIGYHLPDDFGTTVLRGISYLPFQQDDKVHNAWGIYRLCRRGRKPGRQEPHTRWQQLCR